MTGNAAAGLFVPRECWGWEYREPETVAIPFARPEPVPAMPAPPGATRARGWARKEVFDMARMVGVLLSIGVVAIVATLVSGNRSAPAVVDVAVLLGALLCAGVLVLSRAARLRYRIATATLHAEWLRRCAESRQRFRADQRAWQRERGTHDDAERTRLRTESPWVPLVPAGARRRVDVYGGGPGAWAAWLAVTCGSLVGSGSRVTVLDVSRSGAGDRLAWLAEQAGRPHEMMAMPMDWAGVDLFADLTADQVARLLCEAVHATERDTTSAARGVDARVLGLVCGALAAPLTIGRIGAALRVLLHQQPMPAGAGDVLDLAEYDRINALFGETMRRQVEPRVATLEALLHSLADLGGDLDAAAEPAAPLPDCRALLRVATVADLMADLPRELLIQVLLQLALADVRASGEPPVLVLAGADRISTKNLETLAEVARNRGGRVVYLFEHLRAGTTDLLGDADLVYLMRLGNGVEAATAAEFIGREYRFVLHQFSDSRTEQRGTARTIGRSTGLSHGESTSMGGGGSNTSLSEQHNTGESWNTGTSTTRGSAEQRVYEFAVEPVVLQQLADTAFVVVSATVPGEPRARFGDCDPRIATDPANCPPHPLARADP